MIYLLFSITAAFAQPSSPLNQWTERPDLISSFERLLPTDTANALEYRGLEASARDLGYAPAATPRLWLDLANVNDDDCVDDRRAKDGYTCRAETAKYRYETVLVKDQKRFYLVSEGTATFTKSNRRPLIKVKPESQGLTRERGPLHQEP